jgi:CheY-like chemotaxis protein
LVAEDEAVNFFLLELLLKSMDFTLIHAKDGQEAVDICKANSEIDLILMDIKMPVMDGHEAAKQIKKIRPELVIIAQSAYTLEQYLKQYGENPFDEYISKPIKKDVLKQKIMKFIDK